MFFVTIENSLFSKLSWAESYRYQLELWAKAVLSNKYKESDLAWMDMKTNAVDVIIAPIESYEDQLYG